MMKRRVDFCIIGAGSGGLTVAAVAAQFDLKVILIEKNKMGGDCLNYGCVPSKALLAAGKRARAMQTADVFGIDNVAPTIDMMKVMSHVQGVIQTVSPHDSLERFIKLGVEVIFGEGRFIDKKTVQVEGVFVEAKHFIIATGTHPAIPPTPGLENVPYLTNETVFSLKEKPTHLIIMGGGPIGCELAQAFLDLGVKVTVLEMFQILPKDESEMVTILREKLIEAGVNLRERVKVLNCAKTNKGVLVTYENAHESYEIAGSHLLVATGRRVNIENLNLEAASVKYNVRGIKVNAGLRTTNKRIYAIGDCIGRFQFTHAAGSHAGVVIRRTIFKLPAKMDEKAMPWVTYTHPELAHVGLTKAMAEQQGISYHVAQFPFSDIDRAQAEHATMGGIMVLVGKKAHILGATILGENAGELIVPWGLAIQQGLKMSAMANMIVAYPTLSDITKRVASHYYASTLYSAKMKKLVRWLNNIFLK